MICNGDTYTRCDINRIYVWTIESPANTQYIWRKLEFIMHLMLSDSAMCKCICERAPCACLGRRRDIIYNVCACMLTPFLLYLDDIHRVERVDKKKMCICFRTLPGRATKNKNHSRTQKVMRWIWRPKFIRISRSRRKLRQINLHLCWGCDGRLCMCRVHVALANADLHIIFFLFLMERVQWFFIVWLLHANCQCFIIGEVLWIYNHFFIMHYLEQKKNSRDFPLSN